MLIINQTKTLTAQEVTMKNVIQFFAMITMLAIIVFFSGCVDESMAPISPQQSLKPKGTISGKIFDKCTGIPINGAVMSVGWDGVVQSTTSDTSGSFSFADVPAGQYKACPSCSIWTGTYSITASLVNYNKRQTDSAKRYKDYKYMDVTISFTSLAPGDSLGVSGLVGSVACSLSTLSTTLKGTVVNQALQPVANAGVIILDHFTPNVVIAQTTTGSDGSFRVSNLENGSFFDIHAKSADGSLEAWTIKGIPCNQSMDSIRTQVSLEQLVLAPVDNVQPFVTSITPENKADVSVNGLEIVYTFSEPIKQNTYTRVDSGYGYGTIIDDITCSFDGLKKTQAALPISRLRWASNYTQLILTPSGLVGSAKYSVSAATAMGKLTDIAGNSVVNNSLITGDFETLNFTTAGGTAVLAAPTVTRRSIRGLLDPLDYNGGIVGLQWNNVANARSYNVYRSIGNGPFEMYHKDVFKLQDTVSTYSLVNPQSAKDPLASLSVRYQVRAVSADLIEGSASNSITVSDEVLPTLFGTVTGGSANNWLYTLQFSEPLTINVAQTLANYLIQYPDTVTFTINDVDYLGYNTGTTRYDVRLNFSTNLPLPAGYSIRVKNLTDLAGNIIDSTTNRYVSSAPPVPVLLSPNNGATGIGLPSTLTWGTCNGATTYRLQVSTNVGFTVAGIVFDSNNLPNPINTTSYAVSSTYLTLGITYYWRVSAINTAGTSANSAVRNFVP